MGGMGRASSRSGSSRSSSRPAAGSRGTGGSRRGGQGTRRRTGQAQPARGRRSRGHVSWARRIGIVGALLLAGVSVVFAGQALQPPAADRSPDAAATGRPAGAATATPTAPAILPVAPTLDQPAADLVTTAEVVISGRLTEDLPRDGRYRLRLYINGELVRDRRLPRRNAFTLPAVPLSEGDNSITAAVTGPAGESLHSAPIAIELDTQAPPVTLSEPAAGVVYTPETVVRGRSEPGVTLSVSNRSNRAGATLVVADDGAFEVALALAAGRNDILVEARDRAGNASRASVTVERRDGRAAVSLSLTRRTIALAALPAMMTIRARIVDPAGQPVDGAEVTFTFSPPGLPTSTHVDTSRAGMVTWAGVRIGRDGAQRGQGLVAVLVVMPDGTTLQESEFFTIE
jgi:hypothetical protein